MSADDRKTLASSLEYLMTYHPTSLTQLDARLIHEESTRALFGIDEEEARSYIWYERTSDYLEIPSVPLSVSGYSLAYPVMYGIAPGITVTQHNLSATLSGSTLTLATSDYEETIDLTPLYPIVKKYYDDQIAPSPESFAFESQHFKVVVSDLQYAIKDEEVVIENMGVWVVGRE